jgi:hypothetical protein
VFAKLDIIDVRLVTDTIDADQLVLRAVKSALPCIRLVPDDQVQHFRICPSDGFGHRSKTRRGDEAAVCRGFRAIVNPGPAATVQCRSEETIRPTIGP